jgi:hypothetical protein
MLSQNIRSIRFAGIGLCIVFLCGLVLCPVLNNGTVSAQSEAAEKQMAALKTKIEGTAPVSRANLMEYDRLAKIISDCSPTGEIIKTFRADDPLAPLSNLCINGSLAVADPNYNRILTASTGTGVGNGTAGNCSLSGSGNAVEYDTYSFNLTGCAVFPTQVTAQLCGPAGCTAPQALDTVLTLYRNVPAGDPLTANGGLPGVFNPASACTNARGASDDSAAGAATSAGGATCDQLNTADCLAPCGVSTSLSEFKRTLGNGRFTIVVGGFGNATTGNYNLYVDAPAAGCTVALAPSAANGGISGRVVTPSGRGIGMTTVTVSGGNLPRPITALTNPFGYYTFAELEAGQAYSVSVSAKGVTFANPIQIVTVQDDIAGVDFMSIE